MLPTQDTQHTHTNIPHTFPRSSPHMTKRISNEKMRNKQAGWTCLQISGGLANVSAAWRLPPHLMKHRRERCICYSKKPQVSECKCALFKKTKLKELLGILCIVKQNNFSPFKAMFTLQKSHTLKHRNREMHHLQEGCVTLAQPCPSKAETQNPSLPP